jgi:hypothetical protein
MESTSTVDKYQRTLKKYHKLDHTNPHKILKYLKSKKSLKQNIEKSVRKPEKLSLSYIKLVLCAFKFYVKTNDPENEKLLQEYSNIIKSLSIKTKEKEVSHLNKFTKIKWKDAVAKNSKSYIGIDKVITAIYTLFPPRRVIDYAFMVYIDDINQITSEDENYYVKNDKLFIFQNYKTKKKFGIQKFKVSLKLRRILNKFIDEEKIEVGDPLLKYEKHTKDKKKKFNVSNLTRKLYQIFKTSVDGLRHSYITEIYKDSDKLFDIKEISNMMGHDIETHLKYMDKENI